MAKSAPWPGSAAAKSSDAHRTLSDRVYEEIYRKISSDEWPQGERLPTEIDLAQQFGVSRTALREALLRLRIDGLITSRPGAGSFVTGKPSRSEAHTSELQSLMRISYAVFGLKKKK